MSPRSTRFYLVLTVTIMILPISAKAQDFRIKTEIFAKGEKEPASQNLTLFSGSMVYDFLLTEPQEITIFDRQNERFILLDLERRVRLTATKQDITKALGNLRDTLRESERDPVFFEPAFQQQMDKNNVWMTLSNDRITYEAKGDEPRVDGALARYREFADWYARLNSTRSGTMPPFPRLELNKALAGHGVIPNEVRLKVKPKSWLLGKTFEATSKHAIVWQLSSQDRSRIEKANEYLATFDDVSFTTYRQLKTASR